MSTSCLSPIHKKYGIELFDRNVSNRAKIHAIENEEDKIQIAIERILNNQRVLFTYGPADNYLPFTGKIYDRVLTQLKDLKVDVKIEEDRFDPIKDKKNDLKGIVLSTIFAT